jgi:hypothetical protein
MLFARSGYLGSSWQTRNVKGAAKAAIWYGRHPPGIVDDEWFALCHLLELGALALPAEQ